MLFSPSWRSKGYYGPPITKAVGSKHALKIAEAKKKKKKDKNELRRPAKEHPQEYYQRKDQIIKSKEWQDDENELHLKEGTEIYEEIEFGVHEESDEEWTNADDIEERSSHQQITLANFPLRNNLESYSSYDDTYEGDAISSKPPSFGIAEQQTHFNYASLDVWRQIMDVLSPIDRKYFAQSCKSARRITFALIDSVTISEKFNQEHTLEDILIFLKTCCPRLLGLNLSKVTCMNDRLIAFLPSSLRFLNVRGCNITPASFHILSKLSLHCLDVSENSSFRRKALPFPPSLQHLKMDFCIHMKNPALKHLPQNLKSVSLIRSVSISKGKIQQLQTLYQVITEMN